MPRDHLPLAILLRLSSVLAFALMNVGIKLAEAWGARLGEIMFWRQAGAALLVAGIVAAGPGFGAVRTDRIGAHVGRTTLGLVAMMLTFATLTLLPLAEATTLGFSMPIFATVLGALVLREPTGWWRWGAVLAGFAGVVIVARPGSAGILPLGIATGLGAALGTATVSILLRTLGKTERPLATVFWFSILSLVPLGGVYAVVAGAHPPAVWAMLLGIGLLGGLGQLAMTSSLTLGPVSSVVPMDYSALLWATLFGWWVFGRWPAETTWIGAPVIVASGLVIVWREQVRRRDEARQAVLEG
jgi:drug/metabolite transporter (DMT)-like permease